MHVRGTCSYSEGCRCCRYFGAGGTRAYLPNSPLNTGTDFCTDSLDTIRSLLQWELQSNNRKGLRGIGREGQLQEGLLGSPLPHRQVQVFLKLEKKKKKNKSSFQLQIGQTMEQSNYTPPLSILPMPAAGSVGSVGLWAETPKAPW